MGPRGRPSAIDEADVHSAAIVLVASVFLASAVEMVEALTIVIAMGVTRGWRSALEGAGPSHC